MLVLVKMKSQPIVITVLIWLTLTIVFAAFGFKVLDWQKWNRLAKYGVETKGKILSKQPDNHRFVRYSYTVGQQTYFGLGSARSGNPEFDQLNVGDEIKVFYDPDDPAHSILGSAEAQASSITRGVLFLAIAGPLFSMIGLYLKGWLPVSK